MEKETAESKLRTEKTRSEMAWQDEQRQWMKETKLREDQLRGLAGAQAKFRAGIDLDDDDLNHVVRATRAMDLWKDLPVDQWQTLHKNLDVLKSGVEKYWPIINKQMEQGKGAYFSDEQAPDLFNALNKVYGSQIARGKDRHGETQGVEKRINRLYFDPRNGTMTPLLEVKDSKGDTYFSPMTVDRGNDPDAPVLQIPYQMFGAHLNSHIDMSKMIDAAMIKLGDKETKKRVETETQTLKENEVWLAGSEAMYELMKTKPNASKNELANAFERAVIAKSKETGIPIKRTEITTEIAKISEKQPFQLGSPVGKTLQDRAKLIAQGFSEDSPEIKAIDAATAKATKKSGSEISSGMKDFEAYSGMKPEQRGTPKYQKAYDAWEDKQAKRKEKPEKEPSAIREFEEVEKMPAEKKGRFYKHRELMKEKPTTEVLSVTEQREMRTEALGRFTKLLPDELGDDYRDAIIKRKNLDELISNLPDEQQSQAKDMVDRATELKKENRKLTWNQAFNQAEKELGKIEKALKPITQEVIDSIKKEIKKMKILPKTPEDARALARTKARERGYDPEKRATE